MNGRVYDPFLARMISADPTVPGAFNSQAFNRYSYVLNNPLGYTDPSGFTPLAGARGQPHADGAGGYDFGLLMPNEGCTGSSATGCAGTTTGSWSCASDGSCMLVSNGTIRQYSSGNAQDLNAAGNRAGLSLIGFVSGVRSSSQGTMIPGLGGVTTYYISYSVDSTGCGSNLCTNVRGFNYSVPNYTATNLTRFSTMPGIGRRMPTAGSGRPTTSLEAPEPRFAQLRANANHFVDPNNYGLDTVAPGFIPNKGEQILGNVAIGLAVASIPPLAGMTAIEGSALAVGYFLYDLSSSDNTGSRGVAYIDGVVSVGIGIPLSAAPYGIGPIVTNSFSIWMGFVEYECASNGHGC